MTETLEKLDPKTDGSSMDVVQSLIDQLRPIVPEAFTEDKIDFDLLRELLGDDVDDRPERYSFNWHGKSRARRIAQTPSTGTLRPCPEESVNWDTTKNIFIEGDNLEVLKLMQKSYHKRVKMIYIDPPYNTGKEFIYPDKFQDNLDTYLKYTGQVGEDGLKISANAETGGRYHTNWLNMMYPRLKLARNVLRDDGVIFISIDDHEQANVKKLCDEIFGEENFVASFIWQKRTTRENRKVFSFNHDFVICFARNKPEFEKVRNLLPLTEEAKERYSNPDEDPRGSWQSVSVNAQAGPGRRKEQFYPLTTPGGRVVNPPAGRCWIFTKDRMDELIADNRIWFGADGNNVPRQKQFFSESTIGLTPHTLWTSDEVGTTDSAKRELTSLFGGVTVFDTPKPVELMSRIVQIALKPGEIALDFFAGSAPLAEAIIRHAETEECPFHFIMVQLPEPVDESLPQCDEIRALGLNSIADISKERIRRSIKERGGIADYSQTGVKVFKLDSSNIQHWDGDALTNSETLLDSIENIKEGRSSSDLLIELLLKFGLGLVADVKEIAIEGEIVFCVGDGALVVCLADDVSLDVVDGIAALKDELNPEVMRVVFKDSAFADDVSKTNALQILRQRGVEDVKSL